MESAVLCRDASPGDAAAIVDFQLRMAEETEGIALDRHLVSRGVEAVFADPALGRYLVATAGGEVTGSLLVTYEWSDWRNAVVWWIQSVYVAPSMRGRGVYAALYRHVQSLAGDEPGVAGIRLYVDHRNSRAQEVYRRLGMNGDHYRVFEWMKDF
jgi:ribosomal protein S18 acetylase RimI-like enzyme